MLVQQNLIDRQYLKFSGLSEPMEIILFQPSMI